MKPICISPIHDLVQRALVGHVELLGVGGALLLGIAAHGRARRALICEMPRSSIFLRTASLAGGNNHAGVGHGDADAGSDLGKQLVRSCCQRRWGR